MITPIKEIVNDTNGRVFNYRWMYGYKIQMQGKYLTPQFLLELMVHTWRLSKLNLVQCLSKLRIMLMGNEITKRLNIQK